MPWGGFIPPIPSSTPSPTNPAPVKKPAVDTLKPAANKKLDYYIDKDLVEAVISERNWRELNWLHEVLDMGIKIRNPKTGRYLKIDRYMEQIEKIKNRGDYSERTTPSGELQEIPSDSFEE